LQSNAHLPNEFRDEIDAIFEKIRLKTPEIISRLRYLYVEVYLSPEKGGPGSNEIQKAEAAFINQMERILYHSEHLFVHLKKPNLHSAKKTFARLKKAVEDLGV